MKVEGANAYSTVLFMKHGNFTALLTGDCEQEGQDNIKRVIHNNPDIFNNIDLLKVAHHGSKYTTDTEFLEMIKPRIALISCGEDNRYGHPHSEVLERLADIGTIIYRTDISGEIEVNVLDGGEKLKISEFIKYEDAGNRH
jgi:competence protein ComEC